MSSEARRHHLTDNEFSNLLFGEQPDSAVAAHLDACDHCREELEAVGGSLSEFREIGTAWAQRRAPVLVTTPPRWVQRLVSVPSWGTGLAVTTAAGIIAFALGLPSGHPHATTQATAAKAAPKVNLTEDNRLMLSIDQELSYTAPESSEGSRVAMHEGTHPTAGTLLD